MYSQSSVDRDNRQLLILSHLEPELKFLCARITEIFGNMPDLVTWTKSDLEKAAQERNIIKPKAVLVSLEEDKKLAEQYFKECRIISVKRMLACENIETIMDFPENTELIVVNNPEDCAVDTVKSLQAMGINHLTLIPYWPDSGMDLSGYDTVVYPGFREFVPDVFKQYIDIGYRYLSFATIFEIANELNLPYEHIQTIYEKTTSLLVEKGYDLRRMVDRLESSERNFRMICEMSTNGIIGIDLQDKMIICNQSACAQIGMDRETILTSGYQSIFAEDERLLEIIAGRENVVDMLATVCGKNVVINTYGIDVINTGNYFVNLVLVDTIQNTEIKVRQTIAQKGFAARYKFSDIQGKSEAIKETLSFAKKCAKCDLNVLITGESGTGKELFAQAIHNASNRSRMPFVAFNFAALPEPLIESELFGYEGGAFTGALKTGKAGLFELAHNGTLFLDEIGDASLSVQARLLRVLEEKEVMRIGASKNIPINVRIICATNKSLAASVHEGSFRRDLLYRIDVLPLRIPNLRSRKEDILPILSNIAKEYRIHRILSPEILLLFQAYDWPGNARELRTAVQYLSIIGNDADSCDDKEFIQWTIAYFQAKREEFDLPDSGYKKIEDKSEILLNEIYQAGLHGMRIGRNSLLKRLTEKGVSLSEAECKNLLTVLKERGLISQGRTKQGVQITEAGKTLLVEHGIC
ncbi:Fis family transcriptional regulator [Clostridia bacterium]|nr:Fis family transcriptional regulator [Clostridia bacterium]